MNPIDLEAARLRMMENGGLEMAFGMRVAYPQTYVCTIRRKDNGDTIIEGTSTTSDADAKRDALEKLDAFLNPPPAVEEADDSDAGDDVSNAEADAESDDAGGDTLAVNKAEQAMKKDGAN